MQLTKESLIVLSDLKNKFSDKTLLTQIHAYTFQKPNTDEPINVIVNGNHKFCLTEKITEESLLESLYESCEPSICCTLLEGEDKHDESMKIKSRESKDVKIKNLLGCIPVHFAKQYHYELCKVVVYKTGDFLSMHTDTLTNNLRYRMIITLDTDFTGGNLRLEGINEVFVKKGIIIFNPATAHEVEKIKSGYRISILINLFEYKQAIQFSKITTKFNPIALVKIFKGINFKQFGHAKNIWFSHPLLDIILPILDENNIKYVEAIALGEESKNYYVVAKTEFFEYIDLCKIGFAEFSAIDSRVKKIFFETYQIDFTLCRGEVESKQFSICHYPYGNHKPVYELHEINYITGIVIMLGNYARMKMSLLNTLEETSIELKL